MNLEWKCATPWIMIALLPVLGMIGLFATDDASDVAGLVVGLAIIGAGCALGFTITYFIANRISGNGTLSLEIQCLIPWLGLLVFGVAMSIAMATDIGGETFDFVIGSAITIAICGAGYYITRFIASRC